jgi:hypothetical protein
MTVSDRQEAPSTLGEIGGEKNFEKLLSWLSLWLSSSREIFSATNIFISEAREILYETAA